MLMLRHAAVLALWVLCPALARQLQEDQQPQSQQQQQQHRSSQPDYDVYHTQQAVFAKVESVVAQHPSIMRLEETPLAEQDYAAALTVVTVEPGGLTNKHSNKLRLLLNFGEHGRELVTSEVALKLLELLGQHSSAGTADHSAAADTAAAAGKDPAGNADAGGRSLQAQQLRAVMEQAGLGRQLSSSETLQELLQKCVFKIIPMENTRGRELVERGALCERKNGRGVDPNRNWDVHWGFKERDYDPAEEYPGGAPFSEPETALMLVLAESFTPHVWLNVHSGMEALFMPYDHRAEIPTGEAAQITLRMLQELNQSHCGGRCAVGSGGKSVGYLAHGTATDFMYEALQVPLAFTWEIYGDQEADYADCFRMFNPLTREHLDAVVQNWAAAVLRLVELLPLHPACSALLREQNASALLAHRRGTSLAASEQQGAGEQQPRFRTRVQREHSLQAGAGAGSAPAQPPYWQLVLALGALVLLVFACRALWGLPASANLRRSMRRQTASPGSD